MALNRAGFSINTQSLQVKALAQKYEVAHSPYVAKYEKIEVAGDPNVGKVIWFPMIHPVHLFNHVENGDPQCGFDVRYLTAIYHLEMLHEMSLIRSKHVFSEGVSFDARPGEKIKNYEFGTRERAAFIKRGSVEHRMDKQLGVLFDGLASLVYFSLFQDVTLHKTSNVKLKPNKKEVLMTFQEIDKMKEDRELYAAGEIMSFFKKNPGETVILLFGEAHDFKLKFREIKRPSLVTSIRFPYLLSMLDSYFAVLNSKPKSIMEIRKYGV